MARTLSLSLRWQLGLTLIIALVIPIATLNTVDRIEISLQQNLIHQLTEDHLQLVRQLPPISPTGSPSANTTIDLNATVSAIKLNMDGYLDDWPTDQESFTQRFNTENTQIRVQTSTYQSIPYLAMQLQTPLLAYADHQGKPRLTIEIDISPNHRLQLKPLAPGSVAITDHARVIGTAYWQDSAQGYSVEMTWPFKAVNVQQITINIVNNADQQVVHIPDIQLNLGWPNEPLSNSLLDLSRKGNEHWLITDQRYQIAHVERLEWMQHFGNQGTWIFNGLQLIREFFEPDETDSTLPQHTFDRRALVLGQAIKDDSMTVRKIKSMWVIRSEIALNTYLISATNDTQVHSQLNAILGQFIQDITPWLLFMIALVLTFSGILIKRIRRLGQRVNDTFDAEGKVRLPERSMPLVSDELVALESHWRDIAQRTARYQTYLEDVGTRLNHELRTPLSVVSTSLEHMKLRQEYSEETAERANDAVMRLRRLLNTLSESRRLEQSLHDTEKYPFELMTFLHDYVDAMNGAVEHHEVLLESSLTHVQIFGSKDLIAQALDKFLENAISFAPTKTPIILHVKRQDPYLAIEMYNEGSSVEASFSPFDQFATRRSSDQHHLGLGLYIVKLVADYHAGKATLHNAPNNSGVIATLSLPL